MRPLLSGRLSQDIERDRYAVAEEIVLYRRNALAIVQQTGDKSLTGFARFALGVCLLWSGHLAEAEQQMHVAMHIGEQVGDATVLARCLTFLLFIFRQQGQVEKVRQVITHAQMLPEARNIRIIVGHRAWLAWRDGDLSQAESYGRALLEDRH